MKTALSLFHSSFLQLNLLVLTITGCSDTFTLDDLGATKPTDTFGDTTYVLQQPLWTGFNQPKDVHVGFEPFIYVADAGNNRIVMLDIAGNVIGASRTIDNPVAIAQDYRMNLLVCGEFDTTIGGQSVTFGALYKIDMFGSGHAISSAAVRRVYFDPVNTNRRFSGVAVLGDNSYYVTRTGPSNTSIIDPDDAVLYFDKNDRLTPRSLWPNLSADGTGLGTITQPTSITTLPRLSTDFIFTQKGSKSLFKTQWMTFRTVGDVTLWESYYTPTHDGDLDFLRVNLFRQPEDVTLDRDGNIFVIDAGLDSLFKFSRSGFLTQAFGGATHFNNPEGVAFFDRTLYIADTGNNRILRYVLSTDLR